MISQDGYALAPSVNDLIQLDFYKKQGYGWFDGVTAKDYGRAFFSQLPTVIKLLQKNPATRQAVIRLPGDTCLESVQFLWREIIMDGVIVNVLLCIANFRSIDAVKGLPLDLEILRRLASYVSTMLSDLVLFDQAPITINAGSFHIYFDDIEMV
jgi:thymidylate synthase